MKLSAGIDERAGGVPWTGSSGECFEERRDEKADEGCLCRCICSVDHALILTERSDYIRSDWKYCRYEPADEDSRKEIPGK